MAMSFVSPQEEFSPRFFLPDGSRNVTLKDTIANALRRTKWDSVYVRDVLMRFPCAIFAT